MIIETTIDRIYPLYLALPEFENQPSLAAITERIGADHLCIAYLVEEEPVGFKLGYALDKSIFYSWIGGVDSAYRGRGIAGDLLRYQESWARDRGFQSIAVKSMNRFIPMVQMLLAKGYQIDGFTPGASTRDHKIHFRKAL